MGKQKRIKYSPTFLEHELDDVDLTLVAVEEALTRHRERIGPEWAQPIFEMTVATTGHSITMKEYALIEGNVTVATHNGVTYGPAEGGRRIRPNYDGSTRGVPAFAWHKNVPGKLADQLYERIKTRALRYNRAVSALRLQLAAFEPLPLHCIYETEQGTARFVCESRYQGDPAWPVACGQYWHLQGSPSKAEEAILQTAPFERHGRKDFRHITFDQAYSLLVSSASSMVVSSAIACVADWEKRDLRSIERVGQGDVPRALVVTDDENETVLFEKTPYAVTMYGNTLGYNQGRRCWFDGSRGDDNSDATFVFTNDRYDYVPLKKESVELLDRAFGNIRDTRR